MHPATRSRGRPRSVSQHREVTISQSPRAGSPRGKRALSSVKKQRRAQHVALAVESQQEIDVTPVKATQVQSQAALTVTKRHGRTVAIHEVATHLAFNVHVKHGYRRHDMTVMEALYSAVGYFHNETANIYTHLMGVLACFYWVVYASYPVHEPHYVVVAVADFCSMICFAGSVLYHTLMSSANAQQYQQLLYFDMAGIWVVNTGAGLLATQLMLPCTSIWIKLFIAFGPPVGAALWILFFAKSPASRAASFGVQLLVRFGLIVTTGLLSLTHWTPQWLLFHIFMESWSVVGAVINVLRVPEKWYPGRFDYFQSHTIMHICVAVGMLSQHYLGLKRAHWIDTHHTSLQCIREHHEFVQSAFFWQ